jgi:hypothetical protein
MKVRRLLSLLFASSLLASCATDDYAVEVDHDDLDDDDDDDHTRVVHQRRYISYSDTDPYYRVYYRDGGRTYYRQHYYDDVRPTVRVDDNRYYYRAPASRASVAFGY